MKKRKNFFMGLRRLGKFPNGIVKRYAGDIEIQYYSGPGVVDGFVCSARDARLFAKRINEFLDAGG